ncbi:MAG: DUF2510 domain-containing protein, partial [Microbacteriaceae bacterium]|nr:DUF2510 domain-containing protein [Microbacteriaceae bacterium]
MTDPHTPVAGWYDDPELALRLRWWDGTRWTKHSRPKLIVEHPAEQAVSDPGFVAAAGSGTAST